MPFLRGVTMRTKTHTSRVGGSVTQAAAVGCFELDFAQRGGEQAMTVGATELIVGTGQREARRVVIEPGQGKRDFCVVTDRTVVTEGPLVGIRVTG